MTDKTDAGKCDCPECTAAREEFEAKGFAGLADKIVAADTKINEIIAKEILPTLATLGNNQPTRMANTLAGLLVQHVVRFLAAAKKPETAYKDLGPIAAKMLTAQAIECADMLEAVKKGAAPTVTEGEEIPEAVKAFAEMMGIDLTNVKVISFDA